MAIDVDPDVVLGAFLSALHMSVVDPRCDECGRSLPKQPTIQGPFLCSSCTDRMRVGFAERLSEFTGKRRRFHVVKLPEGMIKR